VIGFVAAIGHERVVWTKIVAAALILFGTMTLISAAFKLDC
jgi:drug/metabolite transporter (DMT)-like permease